jgi:hypothetical protein
MPFTAGRARIAQLLSDATAPPLPPLGGKPQRCPDDPTPEQLWSELLDDRGASVEHLSHADPHLRLAELHRAGRIARIEVTNGARDSSFSVSLDSGEMPAALTVDVADAFRAGSAPW